MDKTRTFWTPNVIVGVFDKVIYLHVHDSDDHIEPYETWIHSRA